MLAQVVGLKCASNGEHAPGARPERSVLTNTLRVQRPGCGGPALGTYHALFVRCTRELDSFYGYFARPSCTRIHRQGRKLMLKTITFGSLVLAVLVGGCINGSDDDDGDVDSCITQCDTDGSDCEIDCDADDNSCHVSCTEERDECTTSCS